MKPASQKKAGLQLNTNKTKKEYTGKIIICNIQRDYSAPLEPLH